MKKSVFALLFITSLFACDAPINENRKQLLDKQHVVGKYNTSLKEYLEKEIPQNAIGSRGTCIRIGLDVQESVHFYLTSNYKVGKDNSIWLCTYYGGFKNPTLFVQRKDGKLTQYYSERMPTVYKAYLEEDTATLNESSNPQLAGFPIKGSIKIGESHELGSDGQFMFITHFSSKSNHYSPDKNNLIAKAVTKETNFIGTLGNHYRIKLPKTE